ncbi:hypothetical protein CHCC14600_0138 [Bacillus licheniformis]|nr:hypothetical protein CHCC15543_0407 [Bacillus licheniformis]TWM57694.1 hypothetical protein CHCC14815_2139 [Bacillus licheniformis]TWM81947.1 hypothetical protein CHCC14600_0138 [Bacillus licheniformis]TWM99335.1 hypothetical protein CHCC14596_3671 [Bacillus licheniformis]
MIPLRSRARLVVKEKAPIVVCVNGLSEEAIKIGCETFETPTWSMSKK